MNNRFDALALPWCAAFTAIALALFVAATGLHDFVEMLREGGLFAFATIGVAVMAAMCASACVAVDVPRPVSVGVALAPWLVGTAGSRLLLGRVLGAIASVSVDDRNVLLAEGTKEVLATRDIGALASAGALLGLAIAFFVRARKDKGNAIAGAGASLAAMFLATRSHGLAHGFRHVLEAAVGVDIADRAVIAADTSEHMARTGSILLGLALVGGIVAVVGLVLARKDVVGVVVALVLVAIPLGVDAMVIGKAQSLIDTHPPWDATTFQPVTFERPDNVARVEASASADRFVSFVDTNENTLHIAHDEIRVALDKRANKPTLDAVLAFPLATQVGKVTFVGAALPSPLAKIVTEPFLAAVLVPRTSSQTADIGCKAEDLVAHLASTPGGPGFEVPVDRNAPIKRVINPSARLCIAIGDGDTGATLAAALDVLAANHVPFALGDMPKPVEERREGGVTGALDAVFSNEGLGAIAGGNLDAGGAGGIGMKTHDDVGDALEKEVIQRVVRRHMTEVQSCYENGLAHDPALMGKVTASFTIEPDGHVEKVSAKGDASLDKAGVSACIAGRAKNWTFPSSAGSTHVSYPFVLRIGN